MALRTPLFVLALLALVGTLAPPATRAQVSDTQAPDTTALPDTADVLYRPPGVDVDTLFDRSAYEALGDPARVPAALPGTVGTGTTTRARDTLALAEAVALALRRNPDARIARGRAAIAAENHALGNAGLLPSAGLTLRRARQPGFGGGGGGLGGGQGGGGQGDSTGTGGGGFGGFGGATRATTSLDLTANYTLFEGFGRFYAYRRLGAREEEAALRAGYESERLVSDVVTQYYDLARRQQQVRVFEAAVALSREQLRIAQARFEVGLAPELAARQARIDRNEDRATLLEERAALADAQAAFNQLLNRPGAPGVVVRGDFAPGPPLALPALQADALEQNRTLRAERQALRATRLREEEVEAAWWPRLNLTAGYNFNDLLVDETGLNTGRPGGFSYGLTATYSLFEGFNRERRADVAAIESRNRALAVGRIETRLQTALRAAYERYRRSRARIRLALENLDAARLNVEVALARYRLGTITFIDVREVQNTLTRLRSRLLQAQFDAKRAETDLLLFSGRLLEQFQP